MSESELNPNDRNELRLLVELAAAGQLSAEETAEVEELIADKPGLLESYDRLRQSSGPPPSARVRAASPRGGCLLPIAAFLGAAALVIAAAVMVRGGGDDAPDDPVAAVIEDTDQYPLELTGPPELTNFGRLALIYSPREDQAVLLGEEIEVGGTLFADGQQLTEFEAGNVEILLTEIDPDASFVVEAVALP